MSTAVMYFDGGCRPTNPGHAGFAVVIELDGNEFILSRYIGKTTNNVAEYTGLIVGIKYARHLGAEALEVTSDSRLVVEQVHGRWRVKSADLKPYVTEARGLLNRHYPSRWSLVWSARANNVKADHYCGLAINAGRNKNPFLPNSIRAKRPGKIIDPFSPSAMR
jgi:ribonuclease HI